MSRAWTAALVTAAVALALVVIVQQPRVRELAWSLLAIEVVILAVWQVRRAWMARRTHSPRETDVVGRRIAAHVLDWLVPGLVWLAVQWVAFEVAWRTDVSPKDYQAFIGDGTIALWLLVSANFVVLQATTGFTLGKRFLGIRTVDENGHTPGLRRTFIRTLPLLIEQFGLIALWAMSRSAEHQRYGDRWAHTYVVAIQPPRGQAPLHR